MKKLQDLYTAVAQKADTGKQKITASDASRVLAVAFEVLAEHHPSVAFDLVGQGLKLAAKRVTTAVLLVAAMLLCSTAEAAKPFKFRLYDSQCKPLVANLTATQLHKQATTYAQMEVNLLPNISLNSMRERATALRALGIPAVPGMRLGEGATFTADGATSLTFTTETWVSPEFWKVKAIELAAVADQRAKCDRRVYIDAENYKTGREAHTDTLAPFGGKEALRAAMAPFLKVMADKKIVPSFTPGSIDDQVQCLCAEVCPTLEFLEETSFNGDTRIRSTLDRQLANLVQCHAKRRAILDRFPQAKWTPGLYEETMRDWGVRARETYNPTFGEPDCWLFLINRKDELKLGTAEWLTGIALNPLNDCKWFPLRDPAGFEEWQKRGKLAEIGRNERPERDAYRDWYWPATQHYLLDTEAKLCRSPKPFTISADVILLENKPAPFGGVWYPAGDLYSSWQVRHADGRWHLDYITAAQKLVKSACSVAAKIGQQRLVVSSDGAKVMLSCDTETAEVAVALRDVNNTNIGLVLGVGTDADRKIIYGDAVRLKDVMVWDRAVTVPAGVYPWQK